MAADGWEPTYTRVWGTVKCQRRCTDCEGFHHWYDDSIPPEDTDRVEEFFAQRPGLKRIRGCEEFLLCHAICKHCNAVADIQFGDDDGR